MKKNASLTGRLNESLDFVFGEKKQYFIRGLCFIGLGFVISMAYLALLSLAEGTKKSIFEIALTETKTLNFWLTVGMGVLLGTSGVVVMFFRMFPWVKENPGWFTFIVASISVVLGFVGLTIELGFMSLIANTMVIVLIIGYFSKPAYDSWKEIKSFNKRMTKGYSRGIGGESLPYFQKHHK